MTPAREVSLGDIVAARRRLQRHLSPSPLRESAWLSAHTGAQVRLKLESVQPTNAFKIRGALNALERLAAPSRPTIVTASAGNHGRAIAVAGQMLGLRTIVFTPASAPATKKAAIAAHGADLRDDAVDYDAAERLARDYAHSAEAVFVSPYNHPDVIAGAGTIALEILESAPATDVVIAPVGGGGLAAGVAIAFKHAAPHVRVIGVEAAASTPFATSLAHGAITHIEVGPSLADGLVGNLEPGAMTFDYVRRYVDRLVSASEEALRAAIRGLAEEEHLMVEGAGAAATAAVLSRAVVNPAERAVVLVTGGNIDTARFLEVLSN